MASEGLGLASMAEALKLSLVRLRFSSLLFAMIAASCTPSSGDQDAGVSPAASTTSSASLPATAKPASATASVMTEVGLHDENGTLTVPVTINKSIKLNFVLDSGASDVQIPADVVMTMIRSGTLDRSDFIGQRVYQLADGSTLPSYVFRIRSLDVGGMTVKNVTGAVSSVNGSLLLGQSFLSRVTSWSIDNGHRVLTLGSVKAGGDAVPAEVNAAPAFPSPPTIQPAEFQPLPSSEENPGTRWAASYFATGSQNDPDQIAGLYAPSVIYYGKRQSVANIMADKLRYLKRWPVRTYQMEPNSVSSDCDNDGNCAVTGIVNWTAASPAQGRYAAGTAKFDLEFAGGRVTFESSRVISRR